MRLRLGPGPVFVYEWLTSARRWQTYALRAAFVAAILLGLLLDQREGTMPGRGSPVSLNDLAVIGRRTYGMIVGIELTLILLVAPAATAGAVCLDKARGTLDHMLLTDLSNAEIVLGKLGVRLIPVLGLVACVLPVLALSGLLGGIDPLALAGSFLVAIGCAVVGCSLALTLSVYGRKTHEVLMLTYLIGIVWLMAGFLVELVYGTLMGPPPPRAAGPSVWTVLHDWAEWSNPYYLAFAPYNRPGRVGVADYPGFLAACLVVSAALVGLATVRIRRVALEQAGRPAVGVRRWPPRPRRPRWWPGLPGPSLDANPVAWREWRRTRPSWMMRAAWGLYAAFGLLWVYLASRARASGMADEAVGMMNMFQVAIGLLLLVVGAATGLAEERVRGSLDVLLSTPMSTWSILTAKWWGSFRRVGPVAFWPAAAAAFPAIAGGRWIVYVLLPALVLAYGAAINSLGLAVATWVRRPGRAVAVCVTAYVILVVGLPILLVLLMPDVNDPFEFGTILGDPPCGALILTSILSTSGGLPLGGGARFTATEGVLWALIWIAAYIGSAMLLFGATVATFDGCLGRIPDAGVRPPSGPPGRSAPSAAELLALVPSSSGGFEEERDADDE